MSLYEQYIEGFEGLPYVEGRSDCYGLVRRWIRLKYDIRLTNYARPPAWEDDGFNLLGDYFGREGFVIVMVALNRLEIGDLLLMRIASRSGVANHIGIYVGNGYVLHHLYGQKSRVDALNEQWKGRVLDVLRHPDISAKNIETVEKIDLMTLLPPHMREKYERAAAAGTVESAG
jgi:cell wall-associated NlpC family hydrolase